MAIKNLTIRINDTMLKKLHVVADHNGLSNNKQILLLIENYIKAYKNEQQKGKSIEAPVKSLAIRIDEEMLHKLHMLASYEGRSANSQILFLIQEAIKAYEKKQQERKPIETLTKGLTIRIDENMLHKVHIISDYEWRSANNQILALIQDAIEGFEKRHGEIKL